MAKAAVFGVVQREACEPNPTQTSASAAALFVVIVCKMRRSHAAGRSCLADRAVILSIYPVQNKELPQSKSGEEDTKELNSMALRKSLRLPRDREYQKR